MARTTAPFMSLDASGTLGKTLTASRWKGRSYMRLRVIPANPRTPMQTAFRAMMKFLGQQWAGIASIDKATWEVLAAAKNYSPFNAFVSANQRNWASYLAPSKNSPPTRIGTAPTVVAASGSGGIRMATLSQTTTLLNDGWGTIIFRKLGADPSMTLDEVVAVIETAGNALELKYVDTPLVPGTYHYNVIHFTNDGSFDGPGTAVPLTVT